MAHFGGRQDMFIDDTTEGDIELYTTPIPGTAALLLGLGLLGGFGARFARRRKPD